MSIRQYRQLGDKFLAEANGNKVEAIKLMKAAVSSESCRVKIEIYIRNK